MAEENKLAEVNATLDRFAKLIEENAQQLRKDKAEYDRRQAEDRAKDEKRQAEWERQRAEWERQQAEDKAKWERQRAEDKAKWEQQRAEDRAKDEKRQAEWDERFAGFGQRLGGQGNSIGAITEAMTVSENIIDLVNEFEGIIVEHFYFNITKKYPAKDSRGKRILKQHEVDGLADGEKVVVVIEAKTVLTEERVRYFLEKLAKFKIAYPDHSHKDLYGALTFIRIDEDAHQLAEQHGLFIIRASPPYVEVINSKGFKPKKIS